MKISNETAIWPNLTIEIEQFPKLLRIFVQKNPDTQRIEEMATQLVEHAFANEELRNFIRAVCAWGGHPGIAARVINKNQPDRLVAVFQNAYQMATDGRGIEALEKLRELKDLGGVSFASKHLKFLVPDESVVLDSKIKCRLGYATNAAGYAAFLTDCRDIRNACSQSGISYTGWSAQQSWRISDIEMAIFIKIGDENNINR